MVVVVAELTILGASEDPGPGKGDLFKLDTKKKFLTMTTKKLDCRLGASYRTPILQTASSRNKNIR